MFPLNAVLFPGVSVPLRVFEDRYRALIHRLTRIPDTDQRVFGSVAIREGYEVGDHGAQSLFRVGVLLQLSEVEAQPDGSFEIIATGLERIRLEQLRSGDDFPVGVVEPWPEPTVAVAEPVLDRARAVFTAYRSAVSAFGPDPYSGTLSRDPEYLSWTLAACAPLPMTEQQSLLEAEDAGERLRMVTDLLHAELRAINVIPSLPASQVARTRWSPN